MDDGLAKGTAVAEPVSTQVTVQVPAGKVAAFEVLLREILAAAREFEGHLGVDVLRPDGGGAYRIIFRFRDHECHERWMDSAERAALLARVTDLLGADPAADVRSVDGWEGWFVTPGYAPPAPPLRWKMAAVTLAALYPLVLTITTVLGPLTGDWPRPAALLVGLGLTIPLMTWVVMPALTTRLGAWLRSPYLLRPYPTNEGTDAR